MTSERKTAGINYLINFFNHIQVLNGHFSKYMGLLVQADEEQRQIGATEKTQIIQQTSNELREWIILVYIEYSSIFKTLKQGLDKKIKNIYDNEVKKNIILDRDKIEEFIIQMNATFLNEVVQDLLKTNQDLFDAIYGKSKEEQQ